jgi:hypothetical protein
MNRQNYTPCHNGILSLNFTQDLKSRLRESRSAVILLQAVGSISFGSMAVTTSLLLGDVL